MITTISAKLASYLCKKNIIDANRKEIYQYGYEVLISGLTGFAIVMILGIIMKSFVESVLFLGVFVPIRQLTGGYHADSYLKCNIVFTVVFLIVLLVTEVMLSTILFIYMFILTGVFILAVYEFAPMENPNKPLDEKQKLINRKTALTVSVIISVTSIIVYFMNKKVAVLIAMTLFGIAFLMFLEKYKVSHAEKNNKKPVNK